MGWRESKPYNSRTQVDAELKKWATITDSFYLHHKKILEQYPKAEKTLSEHYQSKFNMEPNEANSMARKLLDIAYRSYFIFPK